MSEYASDCSACYLTDPKTTLEQELGKDATQRHTAHSMRCAHNAVCRVVMLLLNPMRLLNPTWHGYGRRHGLAALEASANHPRLAASSSPLQASRAKFNTLQRGKLISISGAVSHLREGLVQINKKGGGVSQNPPTSKHLIKNIPKRFYSKNHIYSLRLFLLIRFSE